MKQKKRFFFIKGFMNDFETALYGNNFKDPENGYRKFIDVRSFAKWFLVQELIGNLDTNMYYVLKSRLDKLVIGPLWDAEWSLGVESSSSLPSSFLCFFLRTSPTST